MGSGCYCRLLCWGFKKNKQVVGSIFLRVPSTDKLASSKTGVSIQSPDTGPRVGDGLWTSGQSLISVDGRSVMSYLFF